MGSTVVAPETSIRSKFFDLIFSNQVGYLCICTAQQGLGNSFIQKFFKWPDNYISAEEFIIRSSPTRNVWFCVNILDRQQRKKEYCVNTDLVWADLDGANPDQRQPAPPIVIQTSKDNTQAIWRLKSKVDSELAESMSRRAAYAYNADTSGWDLTQLLRVPYTINHKYKARPVVTLKRALEIRVPIILFEAMPDITMRGTDVGQISDLPEVIDSHNIIYKFANKLRDTPFASLYSNELTSEDDWSKHLWRLIHVCFEAGMTAEEVYSVCLDSPANKYARDKRPLKHLWRDVLKAEGSQKELNVIKASFRPLEMPQLVNEPTDALSTSFVAQYKDWATEATDAVPEFHDLCAFVLLSAMISNSVKLPTSYGDMVPNLWGLILGDSTLTRKTTAMRMMMELIGTLDRDMVVATDGSVEGLLTGLEQRPNKTSIFFKDEVSGFFDSINRRDYLAGMPETLTALYDVPPFFTRRLRKETISIENPVFIFFGGGVREKVFENLREEYVLSGFIPRFLVVSGNTDMSRLRRTGPAGESQSIKKKQVLSKLADINELYGRETTIVVGGERVSMPKRITASLTEEAWREYGSYEEMMLNTASQSAIQNLALPTFERLSRSLLKMAVILGAAENPPQESEIMITVDHVKNAAWFVQQWGKHSIELIMSAGKRQSEKLTERVLASIERHPGILRSTIMQHYHLTKREADEVLSTLEERQLVQKQPQGRGYSYWAV